MGELVRDRLDLHLHPVDDVLEVVEVGVERRDHPAARVGELEDRAVPDHLALVVAEGGVPDLADLEAEHVVREDPVGRGEGVRPVEVPLPERGLVPHPDVLADIVVLGDRIAEMIRPVPALPVHELDAQLLLNSVESGADDPSVAHALSLPSWSGVQPKASEATRESSRRGETAASMASRSKREAGPWRPRMAASSPRLPKMGAARAFRPSSRSPKASA